MPLPCPRVFVFSLGLLLALGPLPARARTSFDAHPLDRPQLIENPADAPLHHGTGLSSGFYSDTTYYGGTVWAPDSNRWEALRGGTWTFDSGVGSALTGAGSCKPFGFHARMEGWTGLDQTAERPNVFRRSATCALHGAYSFWCGLNQHEADSLCYAAGQGYGNNWNMTIARTFAYPGSGSVTLSFAYAVDAEPDYDYLWVSVDTTGAGMGFPQRVQLISYTGLVAGTASFTLTPGVTLRSTPGPISIEFTGYADGGYSDEDGSYASTCGLAVVDDIALSGAITSLSTFEAGDDGWLRIFPACGPGGDWSDLRALSTLPPPLSFCHCAFSDSVMIFADLSGGHGGYAVDNVAVSPWIDLKAGGDVGRPGHFIQFDGYYDLPLTNYIFVETLAQWYPRVCPSGFVTTSALTTDGFVRYFGGVPNCTLPGNPTRIDFSAVVPVYAEQMRVAVGVLSYCDQFANCTGVTNSTPWFDNIRLGVYGTVGAPIVTLPSVDQFQDNFSSDGTLNPSSTGRVDINVVKGATNPAPGTALGDTLVVLGDGGNQEVRVVFRVRPGVFTNAAALSAWAAARWSPEAGLGVGWYSARMDTAEQGGAKTAGRWMSALHESDPKFGGGTDTDRGVEGDGNQLAHDIFPDHILTPGSRIDYFVAARYLPPDLRNPGGTSWHVVPDTTGGHTLEVEILPSSMAADTSWNCTLYVNHHPDRDLELGALEEAGLRATLPPRPGNPEGMAYDRYDVNASTSAQASFGRSYNTQYGATILQTFAYGTIVWHAGTNPSYNLVDEDANNLNAWMTSYAPGHERFWLTGNGVAHGMQTEGEPTTISFLNNILGARYACDTIRLANCPTGSLLDSTFCVPVVAVAGAHFISALPAASVRGNGCPDQRSFDLLQRNTAVPTARGQLSYVKSGSPIDFAAVSNLYTQGPDFRTVIDGFANGLLRTSNGSPHSGSSCGDGLAAEYRTAEVLYWFSLGASDRCKTPPGWCQWCPPPSGVGDGTPAFRLSLAAATPNPLTAATRINFSVGPAAGPVHLQLFDVTGRLVRTLVDERREPGSYSVGWDGRDADGRVVPNGLYFTRLAAGGQTRSGKLIVAR